MKRYFATFYRGWWLYLFVLAIMLGATAFAAYSLSKGYEATGRIWVDRSTRVRVLDENQTQYYTTPAEDRGDTLFALLQTDSFIRATLEGTSLENDLTGNADEDAGILRSVRENIWQRVLGPNTLEIVYLSDDPVLAQQVVDNAITQFREWLYGLQIEQSAAEMAFYEDQVEIYRQQAEEARQRLEEFAAANPDPSPVSVEYLEFQRLQREYENARGLYTEAVSRLNEVSMANNLSSTYGAGEFRVIDEPTVPQLPVARLQRQLKWLAPGALASFGLVLGAVIVMTWQDKSVRTVEDLRAITGARVIGAVPHLKPPKGSGRGSRSRAVRRRAATGFSRAEGPAD